MDVAEGQTAIPVPAGQPSSGPCRWCGSPSIGTVEVEKARYTARSGVRVLARRAIEVPACPDHIAIVERQSEPEQPQGELTTWWDQT